VSDLLDDIRIGTYLLATDHPLVLATLIILTLALSALIVWVSGRRTGKRP
jgi:hypothetical protein